MKKEKLSLKLLSGKSDKNFDFKDLRKILLNFGFNERMKNKNLRYEMIIYWSNEDEAFIAEIPELEGCIAHGNTRQESLENVLQVADAWIELARENDWLVPDPKDRLIQA